MKGCDNTEGKEATWLKNHNSLSPQSLFMLLGNDANVSLRRAENWTNICEQKFVHYTV